MAGHLIQNEVDVEKGKQPLIEQLVEEVEVYVSNMVLWNGERLPGKLGYRDTHDETKGHLRRLNCMYILSRSS